MVASETGEGGGGGGGKPIMDVPLRMFIRGFTRNDPVECQVLADVLLHERSAREAARAAGVPKSTAIRLVEEFRGAIEMAVKLEGVKLEDLVRKPQKAGH